MPNIDKAWNQDSQRISNHINSEVPEIICFSFPVEMTVESSIKIKNRAFLIILLVICHWNSPENFFNRWIEY